MNPQNPNPYQPPQQGIPPNPSLPPSGVPGQPIGQQLPIQPVSVPGQPPVQPVGTPGPSPQFTSASGEKKQKPWVLIGLLSFFVMAFLGSSGFAFWAYAEMNDYKNNVEEKVAAAVGDAVKQTEETKEKEFLERSKSPHKIYRGPGDFGSIEITYPKTWSAAITEGDGSTAVNGFFHPDFVPGPRSETAFALRLEVLEQPYDRVLGSYESNAKKGSVKISPYKAKRVPQILGSRIDGEIVRGFQGSAVLLPLRDKTIRISTLASASFGDDFNKVVLEKLIFVP